ncbi:hypothetical protein AA12717_0342 [Gluconacetobacter sacchari DSM 12717]|uniref:Uncharacterized protein n=2 Tax=Gluconacetobacter sacchari TaxID=92759 RepID=A0ABQ0P2G8_9PROT|nr:hypothetical protein AA12717_0342 [Gluconacetobacter sacchari DSM 12717]
MSVTGGLMSSIPPSRVVAPRGANDDILARAASLGAIVAGRADAADRAAAVVKARGIDGAADLTLHLLSLAGNAGLSARNPLERCHRDALCGRIHAPHGELVRRSAGQRVLTP